MSLAALVFMFQAVTAAQQPSPEPSIDYVLVREVNHFDYPRRVERHTIMRRGVRMRDEYVLDGIASVTYSNTSTGVSIAISRDAGGRPRSLHVSQTLRRDEPRDAPRPERMRQQDTVAGERCVYGAFPVRTAPAPRPASRPTALECGRGRFSVRARR